MWRCSCLQVSALQRSTHGALTTENDLCRSVERTHQIPWPRCWRGKHGKQMWDIVSRCWRWESFSARHCIRVPNPDRFAKTSLLVSDMLLTSHISMSSCLSQFSHSLTTFLQFIAPTAETRGDADVFLFNGSAEITKLYLRYWDKREQIKSRSKTDLANENQHGSAREVDGKFIQERKHESHWKPHEWAETLQLTRQFCNVCCFIVGHLERLGQSTWITSWDIHCHDRFHSGNSGNIVVLTCHTWNEPPSYTLKHCSVFDCFVMFCISVISVISVISCRFLRVLTNEDIVWLQVSVDNAELVHVPHLGTGWLTMTDYDSARGFDLWPTLATRLRSKAAWCMPAPQHRKNKSTLENSGNTKGTSLELSHMSLISRVFSYGFRIAGGRATHKDLYSLRTDVKRLCNDGTSALVQRAVSFAEIMLVFNFTSGLPAAGRDIPRFLVYLTPCHGMSHGKWIVSARVREQQPVPRASSKLRGDLQPENTEERRTFEELPGSKALLSASEKA